MKLLILIRGLPGSGKSTLAHKLSDVVFEADDFFIGKNHLKPNEYVFNASWIEAAQDLAPSVLNRWGFTIYTYSITQH